MPMLPLADVDVLSILFWSVVLIVIVLLGFFGVKALHKWMNNQDVENLGAGFTLSDLRQLHKSGQMSSEEYEKAKTILLAATHKPAASPKSTDRPPL